MDDGFGVVVPDDVPTEAFDTCDVSVRKLMLFSSASLALQGGVEWTPRPHSPPSMAEPGFDRNTYCLC